MNRSVNENLVLDLDRQLSYGVKGAAINGIDERAKAVQLSWAVRNNTTETQFLVISPLFEADNNPTIFTDVRDMLDNVLPGIPAARVHAFRDGLVWTDGESQPKTLEVESLIGGRNINQFLRFIGQNPTRLTKLRLTSVTTAGSPDMGNFENTIKTMFFSPFDQPVENKFGLSNLINQAFLTNNILDIDFIDQAFPVTLSNEHFFVFQVNPGTNLTLNVSVGAHDSKAQRFWRNTRQKDDILRSRRIGK